MSVALLMIGDGRDDVHTRSYESLLDALGNRARELVPVIIDDTSHELGFAGAIQQGWDRVLETGASWVFHVELDFAFHQPVQLDAMIALLERRPELAQISLKRQPCNAEELAAGGIVEAHPDDFTAFADSEAVWTEHRRYWTTNPSVYATHWCRLGWPQEPQSEGVFGLRVLADPLLRFAIWGAKDAPPRVEHIGDVRAGTGY